MALASPGKCSCTCSLAVRRVRACMLRRSLTALRCTARHFFRSLLEALGYEKAGFHSFRRYRVTHLRRNRVPEDLLRFWVGHADTSITDVYSKVKEDVGFRQVCAANVGLGFALPVEKPSEKPSLARTRTKSEAVSVAA
jgi:hypothetical protein